MEIIHNTAKLRFEYHANGEIALLEYRSQNGTIELVHTLVPPSIGGAGVGKALAAAAFEHATSEGIPVVVHCPFDDPYVKQHSELASLIRICSC